MAYKQTEADKTFTQARKSPSNAGAKVVRTITGARGFGKELPKTRTSKTTRRTVKRDTEAELREKIRQQQIAGQTAALQKRRETALSELAGERSKVKPLFS